ncbi:hypothetical protein [Bacillus thuringiensis]|uniref:hypothetical protein n=1 Tax=Bacillus thuringiensis TaxID=1428 RepID=UPI000BF596F0|nr:hypothetical protein [Bacillus thuringiensis]MED3526404.1 hypothetical protein [Bacillus thuringiensis]PFE93585.1 hypothetical protein CN325_21630 [Bacillus thuringiensis]PGP18771.1 hypothetical protein CN987_30065 [Bacillus thuringiensis]
MNIDSVRKKHEEGLMSLPNVIGVGIGEKNGTRVIQVFVTVKVPQSALQSHEVVPKKIEQYETDVMEIGHVMIQNNVT